MVRIKSRKAEQKDLKNLVVCSEKLRKTWFLKKLVPLKKANYFE
jgi:hypothetical protein